MVIKVKLKLQYPKEAVSSQEGLGIIVITHIFSYILGIKHTYPF